MSFGLVARYRGAVHHDSSRLFVAVSINAFGAGMFFPFALLYYQKATSLSVSTIGFAITTATLITLLVNPVSGALVVRFGSKRIVVYGQLMEAVGFAGYLFVTSASSLFFAALIATSGTRMFYAAFSALIADSVSGSDRDRWYGIVGVSQTVGGSLSGVAATLLIGSVGLNGFRIIIAANVCCLVISSFLLHTSREQRQHRTAAGTSITLIHVLRDRKYMLLVASNGLFILCSMLMGLAFALYAIDGLDAPLWSIAVIGIVSSAMVVCLQSRVVEAVRLCRRTSVMMFAGTLWALACFVFAMAIFIPQPLVVPYLVLAAAIFTTSQLLYVPSSRALAAAMAPTAGRGRYVAMFELSYGAAAAAAPAYLGLLYDVYASAPWFVMVGLVVGAVLLLRQIHHQMPTDQNYPVRFMRFSESKVVGFE